METNQLEFDLFNARTFQSTILGCSKSHPIGCFLNYFNSPEENKSFCRKANGVDDDDDGDDDDDDDAKDDDDDDATYSKNFFSTKTNRFGIC